MISSRLKYIALSIVPLVGTFCFLLNRHHRLPDLLSIHGQERRSYWRSPIRRSGIDITITITIRHRILLPR